MPDTTDVDVIIPSIPSLSTPRTSILRSKSNSDVSSTSSNESKTSSITFAPLPLIEARKRRNGRPVGLASRAEMLRKNRLQFMQGEESDSPPEEEEIPLPDFGKLVKGLWRTVSRSTKERNGCAASHQLSPGIVIQGVSENDEEGGEGRVWEEEISWTPPSTTLVARDSESHVS